jgi:hypothetical protein
MSRTEPDVPSVHIPLVHEHAIAHQPDTTAPGERRSGPVIAALGPQPPADAFTQRREHRNANDTVTRAARSLGLDADW